MKKLLSLIFGLALLPGCALFQKGSSTDAKTRDIQNLCYAAASAGSQIAVSEHPEWRADFVAAYGLLDQAVTQKQITGAFLRSIVQTLTAHVKELKSDKARIAVEAATYVYDSTVGTKVSIEDQVYVLAAATGIRDGLKVGLNL